MYQMYESTDPKGMIIDQTLKVTHPIPPPPNPTYPPSPPRDTKSMDIDDATSTPTQPPLANHSTHQPTHHPHPCTQSLTTSQCSLQYRTHPTQPYTQLFLTDVNKPRAAFDNFSGFGNGYLAYGLFTLINCVSGCESEANFLFYIWQELT